MLYYGKETKIGEDVYYLSDLEYKIPRENIINGLKIINYGRNMVSEDNYVLLKREYIDMLYRMKLTTEEIEYILGCEYIESETINYEIKPGIYEFHEIVDAFVLKIAEHQSKIEHTCKENISLKIKADKKSMKTNLETSHELIFNSDLNKVLLENNILLDTI